jgi:hypothetical protein
MKLANQACGITIGAVLTLPAADLSYGTIKTQQEMVGRTR